MKFENTFCWGLACTYIHTNVIRMSIHRLLLCKAREQSLSDCLVLMLYSYTCETLIPPFDLSSALQRQGEYTPSPETSWTGAGNGMGKM